MVHDKTFWEATFYRVARTFLTTLLSFVTVAGGINEVNWTPALSASALAGVLSALTALIDLPEAGGKVYPKLVALLIRSGKSFVQALLAFIPTAAVFLTDVDWQQGVKVAAGAALGSLILGLISVLPESNPAPTQEIQQQNWVKAA
jgi:hypothetical protein